MGYVCVCVLIGLIGRYVVGVGAAVCTTTLASSYVVARLDTGNSASHKYHGREH